jgi:arylsulfatase A
VPLIIYWPEKIRKGSEYNGLIDFSDFLPSLADIAGKQIVSDGRSFFPLLNGTDYKAKEIMFMHYDPKWGNASKFRNRFARTLHHKLYADGRFFDLAHDLSEKHPLNTDSLSVGEQETLVRLKEELTRHPAWEKY